jgi:hypothetical protein
MKTVIASGGPRATLGVGGALARFGVATVHEAIGRTGYLGPGIRPVHLGLRIGLDRYGLRSVLSELGVQYVDYHSYQEAGP